jgi:hypothetical protein
MILSVLLLRGVGFHYRYPNKNKFLEESIADPRPVGAKYFTTIWSRIGIN